MAGSPHPLEGLDDVWLGGRGRGRAYHTRVTGPGGKGHLAARGHLGRPCLMPPLAQSTVSPHPELGRQLAGCIQGQGPFSSSSNRVHLAKRTRRFWGRTEWAAGGEHVFAALQEARASLTLRVATVNCPQSQGNGDPQRLKGEAPLGAGRTASRKDSDVTSRHSRPWVMGHLPHFPRICWQLPPGGPPGERHAGVPCSRTPRLQETGAPCGRGHRADAGASSRGTRRGPRSRTLTWPSEMGAADIQRRGGIAKKPQTPGPRPANQGRR